MNKDDVDSTFEGCSLCFIHIHVQICVFLHSLIRVVAGGSRCHGRILRESSEIRNSRVVPRTIKTVTTLRFLLDGLVKWPVKKSIGR